MQTSKNKAFPLKNSIIRFSLQMGVILAIILISFLMIKQTIYVAVYSEDMGGVSDGNSNFGTRQTQVLQVNHSSESLLSASPTQNIIVNPKVNPETPINDMITMAELPTPTLTNVLPTAEPTATSVPPTIEPSATRVPPTTEAIAMSVSPTIEPTMTTEQQCSGTMSSATYPFTLTGSYGQCVVFTNFPTVYYVAPTGNDNNPGTLTQPFRTIQKGVNKLAVGDTLYIRGGTYTEKIQINVSGSPSQPITISSYPGEMAIMDGNGLNSTLPAYTRLIELNGSYVIIENLELTYPKGRGIVLWKDANTNASHNIVRNLNVYNTWGVGIQVLGDNNLIENCTVKKADLANADSNRDPVNWIDGYGISIGDSGHSYYGMNTVIRNNKVYDTYGEGIICMYTDNALIESNQVWDNWAENIYLDTCSFNTIRNNLIYYTTDHEYWRFNNSPAAGIEFTNEGVISHPFGHDVKIYNNIIVNAWYGILFWTGWAANSAAINTTITYNTIVNNYAYGCGIAIDAPSGTNHQNTVIENNLVLVNLGTPLFSPTTVGLTYYHNLWSKNPVFLGSGDIVGNPLLNDPTHSVDVSIDPYWYKLTSLSPAIGKALANDVQTDYFWVTRDSSPDIGAIEY